MIYEINMPIMLFPYKEHKLKKQELLAAIADTPKDCIKEDNTIISETDYFLNDSLDKNYMQVLGENFFKQIDDEFCKINHGPWSTEVSWVQTYYKNETHDWHRHHSCLWACVYYVDLPQDAPEH